MPDVVLDPYRPTLGDLVERRPLLRRALPWIGGLLVVVVAALGLRGSDDTEHFVQREGLQFNFVHDPVLRGEAHGSDEEVRLVRRRGDLFLQSFAVQALEFPRYDGDVGGQLPVLADRVRARLASEYGPSFRLVQEGKTRVNILPGYTLVYRWKADGRTFYGRTVLLPDVEGASNAPESAGVPGVALELVATPASGVGRAVDVGLRGAIKLPYRSFRFGTERP